jgi:F420-0:gamma-glutamyl ligase-like protein
MTRRPKAKPTTRQPKEEAPSSKIRIIDVDGQLLTMRNVRLAGGHAPPLPSTTILFAELPKSRHKPKRELNREILRRLFPPDGLPSTDVSTASIKKVYREECERKRVDEGDRYSETQLLRVTNRKKS